MTVGTRLRWLLRRTLAKAWHDRVLGLSAEAAFWQLLSLPSLALAGVAVLGYVSRWFGPDTANRTEAQLNSTFSRAFSSDVVSQIVAPTLHEVLHGKRIDVISIGFILALWAGSSATATFVNTITIAYGMRDMRGAVRSRLLALRLFLGAILLGVVLLPLLVLGPSLLPRLLPRAIRPESSGVIHASYYPVVIVLLLLGLISLYHLAPPRRLPWRRGAPGALFAMVLFLAGSAGLRSYITFLLAHNHAYGTLAAPIAALLYFYVLGLGVLLGAELNAAIEQLSPTATRPPRALGRRNWHRLDQFDAHAGGAAENPPLDGHSGQASPEAHSEEPPPGGSDS